MRMLTASGLALLLLLVVDPSALLAQPEETTEGEAAAEEVSLDELLDEELLDDELLAADEEGDDLDYIDDLLEGDEDVLEGAGFSYDDGGRRDPFRSLLEVAERSTDRGPRPDGIPGLLIDELTITGIYVTVDGPVAQVNSSDDAKSYLLRPGDQLYDGDVVSISYVRNDGAEVLFKQIIDDPTAPKPFREVVRRIEP